MMFRDVILSKWPWVLLLFITSFLPQRSWALIEEIEATPTNTFAFELGDLSMPQFLLFCMVFLILFLLYGYGVVPIEVDLGYFFGTGSGDIFPRKLNEEMDLTKLFVNCPLQYVCEVDMWANRDDHEYFIEKMVASWFKNSNSTFSSAKSRAFGGTGTCQEMYPCPIKVQEAFGIKIPKSRTEEFDYHESEADIEMDLTG